MHMADALLSPQVGGTMMAVTIGITAYSIHKLQKDPAPEESKVPLMGVMGAFVFAAQMINFSIPGTGSSGHLGGGLLLAILLGPFAGFLTMASVLFIQALFFGDGGLLAFGANVFNMGFFSCFVAYPLIYRKFLKREQPSGTGRMAFAAILAAVIGLQLGAFGVVLETVISGKTQLPFPAFVLFMQPIHLAIGIVEGLVTAAVIGFVWNARPELMYHNSLPKLPSNGPAFQMTTKKVIGILLVCVIVMGAGFSLLASANPDGLEWSIGKVTGAEEVTSNGPIYDFFAGIQEKIAIFPDYQWKEAGGNAVMGTSTAGILGGLTTLLLAVGIGWIVKKISYKRKRIETSK